MKGVVMRRRRFGFILLEAMIATTIFAMAVLALGQTVEAGMMAAISQKEDARAQRALSNRLMELEAGAVAYANSSASGDKLEGEFEGMRVRQTVLPLKLTDAKGQLIEGLISVNVEVLWENRGQERVKAVTFYAYPQGTAAQ
jgi:Tfp pilus assembly protein PilV